MSTTTKRWKVSAVTNGGWGYVRAIRHFTDKLKAKNFYAECLAKYLDCEVTIERI